MFRTARLAALLVLALFAGHATAEEAQATAEEAQTTAEQAQATADEAHATGEQAKVFTQASPDAPVVHTLSGFEFPLHVGAFERGDALLDTPSGDDVSVAYNDPKGQIVATLYVYPTHGRSLDAEFKLRQREVAETHAKVKLLSKGKTEVTPKHNPALIARYVFTAEVRRRPRLVHTELLVAQAGNWFVEYRFSYAADHKAQAQPKVDELKTAFAWP